MKSARHAAITQIIESRNIETQEELAAALQERGIRVTQATVSRDIKELHLIKVLSETGGYKYATLDKAEKGMNERFIRMFSESVLSAVCANNLVVVKTLAGSAHVAAEAVDTLRWPEILGSIAGDNTILVICRSNDDALQVAERFRNMMK
ncbi:MAG TPA: arginine repressor [Candidatus Onthenecus intestinigallinarum]|uniref:Arginine repressor n=1 Tax=Candidatus Onthenecus intestinigallinarum TaxID=2840875 RepID=A0A9D0Z996_9FIRM|nr:arginine repressor [Candidatus Onthenecus intestinigallinarum]